MAMNFVARVIVIAPVLIASSVGKPPGGKVCCLREKKHAIALLVEEAQLP